MAQSTATSLRDLCLQLVSRGSSIRFYLRHLRVPRGTLEFYRDNYADVEWAQSILDRLPKQNAISVFHIGITKFAIEERSTDNISRAKYSRISTLSEVLHEAGIKIEIYEWKHLIR
ncbi:hypothetical protein BG015_002783 [Linnemannia schmuckeri]|uniref:Uncharacterized protein n=1 Tax=Linnemannia schmuckeri TaxID=64567 RepID=A0A9P5RN58_9FUNG|nr:hypothetical protein BG015_002783 [Linnemannia schmuckeri]